MTVNDCSGKHFNGLMKIKDTLLKPLNMGKV